MPNPDLPIMIVDDAKFSGAVIGRTLKAAGFKDIRTASSAQQALAMLESRPVNVLIADWLMPEMDGLELAGQVRQVDEATNHFTYIMLLTAKEGDQALGQAFDQGVDDFINKSVMNQQLLPRIYAADRLSSLHNRLLQENQLLVESNQRFKKHSLVDPLTGMGNGHFAIERLDATIKHAQSRQGAACVMIINVDNYKELIQQQGKNIMREIIVGTARRLRQLVRPLDVVARLSNEQFAIVTHQTDIMQANAVTYRRIYDALNVKALKTSKGFVNIKASMCMSAADQETGFPAADKMLAITQQQIPSARETGRLMVIRWRSAKKSD
ncbi:GGDEF domain-containing response regulator [Ketobacter alkanivorans]|uniref:Diguanylate cyclase n=1 Tax=Ketobacter alkanivorans TaxID=1917421 RepID=A0A2K9LP64_9GAMM|nr:response regulator [Ketobacter alkanivorans]AUM14128.1 diguanylate cyclase [Ketobacter alkanivorans]MCP5017708.1 response regulator [Ketobacter sp.]